MPSGEIFDANGVSAVELKSKYEVSKLAKPNDENWVVAIRQALADDTKIDIGLVLVADHSYSESSIQMLCDMVTELCLS
jgi:hypothetical protein